MIKQKAKKIRDDTQRFEVLDGMRGIAAIAVMLRHYFMFMDMKAGNSPVLGNATLAVDLFFMLSGFVIFHSYAAKLQTGMPAAKYLYKRLVRLYPMFILSLIFGSITLVSLANIGLSDFTSVSALTCFVFNAAFLPFLGSDSVITALHTAKNQVFPGNEALWSLCFEMVASIAFLGLYKRSTKFLSVLSVVSLLALILLGETLFHQSLDAGWGRFNFLGGFPRVFYSFCLGIIIYRITRKLPADRLPPFMKMRCKSVLIYSAMMICFAFPMFIKGPYYYLFQLVAFAPLLLIAGSLTLPENKIDARAAEFLGWLSYPLYCLHIPVFRGLYVLNDIYGHFGYMPLLVVAVLLSVFLSIIITTFYDEPIRRLMNAPRRVSAEVATAETG
jgi:peptidoglycan/LPS O-acetylase OafA/YrhL